MQEAEVRVESDGLNRDAAEASKRADRDQLVRPRHDSTLIRTLRGESIAPASARMRVPPSKSGDGSGSRRHQCEMSLIHGIFSAPDRIGTVTGSPMEKA